MLPADTLLANFDDHDDFVRLFIFLASGCEIQCRIAHLHAMRHQSSCACFVSLVLLLWSAIAQR